LPGEYLRKSDVAWVIDYLTDPDGIEDSAILKVYDALSESIVVITVPVLAISEMRANQISSRAGTRNTVGS
jgi:hypothetical protein